MKDSRVDAAIAWLQPLPERERRRVASGPYEAQAVLSLAGLNTEALMVASVAHMVPERALVTLQGVATERGDEAERDFVFHGEPCGRLCLLVNQGPCGCPVPVRVAELRRRQRALLWACEAILRPEPTPPGRGSLKTTLALFQRLCMVEALDKSQPPREGEPDHDIRLSPADRAHLRETAAAVRQRLATK